MSAVASAGSWEYKESFKTPIIMENAETIIYQGKTYKTMQNWNLSFAVGDINYVSSKFFDSETEEMYSYFDVAVNEKYDYILHTNHGFRRGYEGGSLYIEETFGVELTYMQLLSFVDKLTDEQCNQIKEVIKK